MGREWLYWIAGAAARPSTRRGRVNISAEMKDSEGTSSPGCMCAVFQLFDLHPFQISLNQQNPDSPFLQEEAITSKGVEAPRNSLELEEQPAIKEEEQSLNFPAGIQIKTRKTEDFASECSSTSPGITTPNLVARLMGLDLLPECNSPSFSSSNSKPKTKSHFNQRKGRKTLRSRTNRCFSDDDISVGARSLPETPRISSARRSDVEFHRLSLQISKEEQLSAKMVGRKRGRLMRHDENNRSPAAHYAKQIVNQVKETVSRRIGLMDITNTNRSSSDKEEIIRRDQNLVLKKPNNKALGEEICPYGKQSNAASSSPKLRFSDTNKNKLPAPINSGANKGPRTSTSSDQNSSSLKSKNQIIMQENQQQKDIKKVSSGNRKKLHPQACDEAIRNKKEEPFVRSSARNKANLTDKKSKKAPLSNELVHISGAPLLPVKKDPSPPATKLPQKQAQVSDALSSKRNTQLSSNTSHSYKQLHLQGPHKIFTVPENVLPENTNGCATTLSAATTTAVEYKHYIQRILKRTGIIDHVTPLNLGKWHTPSHPLDPSIFYYLELFHPTAAAASPSAAVLSRRCNRKLVFQLVDELLAEILRPHLEFKIWVSPINGIHQFSLADELCKRIENFPAANCQVLEDIDSLIDKDLQKSKLNGFLAEECEWLVCEIEGEILESLVRETVAMVGVRTEEKERQKVMDVTWLGFT